MANNFILDEDVLIDLSIKLNSNIGGYVDRFYEFGRFNRPNIVNFFSGKTESILFEHFRKLNILLDEAEDINSLIRNNQHKFTTMRDWEIIVLLTDMRDDLIITSKIDKFLRSSITNTNFLNKFEFEYVQRQGETLERISHSQLERNDYGNKWTDIALRNDLRERDYTTEGGKKLALAVELNSEAVNVVSVIDNVQGENVLGLDIQRDIEFVNDDIKVLGFEDTFNQTVGILIDLARGDIPEFLDLGTSKFVGSNLNSFGFSALIRQLTTLFTTDDSIATFSVLDVTLEADGGNVIMEFNVESRLKLVVNRGTIST